MVLHCFLLKPVLMVQAAQDRSGYHAKRLGEPVPVYLQRNGQAYRQPWDAWSQRHMRTSCIVMVHPRVQDTSQVVLSERNHKVYAFAPQCAQQPLAERIGLRTLGWGFRDLEPEVLYAAVELRREDAIAIMEEEAIIMVRWERFAQLLQCPGSGGMRGHIDMQNPACRVFHEHKHGEEAKGRRNHHTEITGHDRLGMMAHKGPPSLGRGAFPSPRVQALGQILAYGAW